MPWLRLMRGWGLLSAWHNTRLPQSACGLVPLIPVLPKTPTQPGATARDPVAAYRTPSSQSCCLHIKPLKNMLLAKEHMEAGTMAWPDEPFTLVAPLAAARLSLAERGCISFLDFIVPALFPCFFFWKKKKKSSSISVYVWFRIYLNQS